MSFLAVPPHIEHIFCQPSPAEALALCAPLLLLARAPASHTHTHTHTHTLRGLPPPPLPPLVLQTGNEWVLLSGFLGLLLLLLIAQSESSLRAL